MFNNSFHSGFPHQIGNKLRGTTAISPLKLLEQIIAVFPSQSQLLQLTESSHIPQFISPITHKSGKEQMV